MEGIKALHSGLCLTIKTALKTLRKKLNTANTNSPWANIWEGLLSEGHLRLRFGGLIFGRAYYCYNYYYFLGGALILLEFYGIHVHVNLVSLTAHMTSLISSHVKIL